MADIFNEIDEELRGDQMRRLWSKYSGVIVAIAVLIVLGVAGWRGWDYWSGLRARADGDAYFAALQLSDKGDFPGAQAGLAALEKTGNAGYRTLARLRAAGEMSMAGDPAGAIVQFDTVARDAATPTNFKGLASIRAAYLALDLENRAAIEARLKPLDVAGNPWRHAAREILAVSAWKAGDLAAAKSWIGKIEADAETPSDLSSRMTVFSAVISATPKPVVPLSPSQAVQTPVVPDASRSPTTPVVAPTPAAKVE